MKGLLAALLGLLAGLWAIFGRRKEDLSKYKTKDSELKGKQVAIEAEMQEISEKIDKTKSTLEDMNEDEIVDFWSKKH